VLFPTPGTVAVEHRTPGHTYQLGTIAVSERRVDESFRPDFDRLRTDAELIAERARLDADRQRPWD
jgi:hypothetical protein